MFQRPDTPPDTTVSLNVTGRAALLANLLRKRAAVRNVGAEDLEAMLRDQILWALPVERPREPLD
jgi:hypothetical protein